MRPNHLVIGGYGYTQNWIVLIYSIFFNKKKTIWTGASESTTLNKNFILDNLKSFFVKRFDNSIVYGTKQKRYLIKLDSKEKYFCVKIFLILNFSQKKTYQEILI